VWLLKFVLYVICVNPYNRVSSCISACVHDAVPPWWRSAGVSRTAGWWTNRLLTSGQPVDDSTEYWWQDAQLMNQPITDLRTAGWWTNRLLTTGQPVDEPTEYWRQDSRLMNQPINDIRTAGWWTNRLLMTGRPVDDSTEYWLHDSRLMNQLRTDLKIC